MNIPAICAHFDDIEPGCGETLARLGREGRNRANWHIQMCDSDVY